ncbi:hypothetical protein [Devosia sp. 2618]|uniref:hypothetical protein n=1 Tax=Devosia sp. 2618 TaxID=3156454 RepID=UPI0033983182
MTLNIELPGKRSPLPMPHVRRATVTLVEVDDDVAFADDDTFGSHINAAVRNDRHQVLRTFLHSRRDTIH